MKDDSAAILSQQTITAQNPAERGTYAVKVLFYGSGTDKQRPEFGDNVTIKTKTVDVSPFASIPKPQAKSRQKFWGFDLKKAPINARVWYPDGPGPFPLALIVHGNHNWKEFSDPGYGYLGELLASRGFILASVDENFINGLSAENDGRAWLLLKHLEAWKQFNDTVGGPLYHRVDMNNIAVMGHSRGGEAAALAATFNRLKYYPDDFKQEFKFNFNIKSVVAIAPVDGQYKPTGQFTPLENVNYLLIHGSHDGDVSTAVGFRQYERLRFTTDEPRFKAVLFMYRANHGQWNTVWGNKDSGPRSGRSLDLRALISPEEQRQFAKVVISRIPRSHAAREARVRADVPRPSHGRRVAAEDDVHDAVPGERLPRARRVRRRHRPDDRNGPRRRARRRKPLDVEREHAELPRTRQRPAESRCGVARLEQPAGRK